MFDQKNVSAGSNSIYKYKLNALNYITVMVAYSYNSYQYELFLSH